MRERKIVPGEFRSEPGGSETERRMSEGGAFAHWGIGYESDVWIVLDGLHTFEKQANIALRQFRKKVEEEGPEASQIWREVVRITYLRSHEGGADPGDSYSIVSGDELISGKGGSSRGPTLTHGKNDGFHPHPERDREVDDRK